MLSSSNVRQNCESYGNIEYLQKLGTPSKTKKEEDIYELIFGLIFEVSLAG